MIHRHRTVPAVLVWLWKEDAACLCRTETGLEWGTHKRAMQLRLHRAILEEQDLSCAVNLPLLPLPCSLTLPGGVTLLVADTCMVPDALPALYACPFI